MLKPNDDRQDGRTTNEN